MRQKEKLKVADAKFSDLCKERAYRVFAKNPPKEMSDKFQLWVAVRNEGLIVWTTREGVKIPVKDMTDSHLSNTIKMIIRNSKKEVTPLLPIIIKEQTADELYDTQYWIEKD